MITIHEDIEVLGSQAFQRIDISNPNRRIIESDQ